MVHAFCMFMRVKGYEKGVESYPLRVLTIYIFPPLLMFITVHAWPDADKKLDDLPLRFLRQKTGPWFRSLVKIHLVHALHVYSIIRNHVIMYVQYDTIMEFRTW